MFSVLVQKHRKFSIQGLVGGFSRKTPSSFTHSESSARERSVIPHAKQRLHASKVPRDFAKRVESANSNFKDMLKEAETDIHCLDKCVTEDSEVSSLPKEKSTSIAENVQVAAQKEKSDIVPKIKWGNLEDDILVLCHENLDEAEIVIGDDNSLTCRKSGNADGLVSFDPSCNEVQRDKAMVTLVAADPSLAEMFPLVEGDESYKEIDLYSSDSILLKENAKILDPDNQSFNASVHVHAHPVDDNARDGLNSSNPDSENSVSPIVEDVGVIMESQEHDDIHEDGFLDVAEVPIKDQIPSIAVGDQDILPPVQRSVHESSGNTVSSFGDGNGSQNAIGNAYNTKGQYINAIEEGESSESKERFRQRLWCFLFENLNRAVDELYLLCELECDLEQMREAILVLEEAGSDFKELKSRVEGFEIAKRTSFHSLDGLPLNAKTDHRRTHALSWE
ncbi:hypothetical protein FRX31_014412, partial [Thalictrum thalictroides]